MEHSPRSLPPSEATAAPTRATMATTRGAQDLYEMNERENFSLHTHNFDFCYAAVDLWGYQAQNADPALCLPKSKSPLVPALPPFRSAVAGPSGPAKRKHLAADGMDVDGDGEGGGEGQGVSGVGNARDASRRAGPEWTNPQKRRHASDAWRKGPRNMFRKRSGSSSSHSSQSSPEPITPLEDRAARGAAANGSASASSSGSHRSSMQRALAQKQLAAAAAAPPPRVIIDHKAYPDIMDEIISACSREALAKLHDTSRAMRTRVRDLISSHVVMSLRDSSRDDTSAAAAGPMVDLEGYGCPTGPWFSWVGWDDPKPVIVNCTWTDPLHIRRDGAPAVTQETTFDDVLAQSEARVTGPIRAILHNAKVIDLVGHLRLPPRQPVIACPDVLRVHMHDSMQADEFSRVDTPTWDEHTLNRFAPRRLVILSRFLDYQSTDTNSSALAIAPTCPVNEGIERLVLRIAYDPKDHRLTRSSIRVPTTYRPGLPKSVKEIIIILVPQSDPEHGDVVDDDDDERLVDITTLPPMERRPLARLPTAPRLGMLDSTADWVAGYLPRGVKFAFVGVETLPPHALNLSVSSSDATWAADSAAALAATIRSGIVKQRRLTGQEAIDNAMNNLAVVSLADYRRTVGEQRFALEADE